jgi:hypothetical protein
MNALSILEKAGSFRLIFDPSWVDGCPGCPGPVFNEAIADYAIAGVLRDIAAVVKNSNISEPLRNIARKMVENSSKGLIAGWEDGDDICPPWRFPFPGPKPNPWRAAEGPRPNPWLDFQKQFDTRNASLETFSAVNIASFSPSMDTLMLAGAVKQLASLTTDDNFSSEIFSIGQQMVKEGSARAYDEYCGTKPRPRPKPNYRR